ncbi:hypothetical protein [Fusobacterium mortiferum]|uniref:Uncharacterized protein n=1 Tax=Fusobacterium mortiferum TaxID=850 RepID=A0A414Q2M7_FUSMR|nr:hypothetical protein [Fusobacterium mortiferum]MCF2699812.1 hypothetical protein [Fusobacterium mortiferum]MDY2800389.1 hypothetical protein [Fusobacterium mortiferum]RHF75059.1 hypothetical protein DW663_01315 [Fusobacterium mortiferum]
MLFRDLFEKYKDKIIDFKVFHPAFYFHEYDVADKFLLQIFSESSMPSLAFDNTIFLLENEDLVIEETESERKIKRGKEYVEMIFRISQDRRVKVQLEGDINE